MVLLALTVALSSASGGLLTGYESQHVRLVDARPVEMVGAAAVAQYAAPVTSMSLPQLQAERARLEEDRPGLGGPIAMLAIAGGLLVTDLVLWSLIYYTSEALLVGLTISFVALVGAVVLTIVGAIQLGHHLRERHRIDRDIRAIDVQIRALQSGAPGLPPPGAMPPPPPPPPPLSGFVTESTHVVVAAF